jgi:hypothetical protein
MSLAIVLVVAAVIALILILRGAISSNIQISAPSSLAHQIQPIDVEAFRNLADPGEDDYLRQRLPASELRRVRRERLRAMAVYVQVVARNAAVLIHVGQSALNANDPRTAAAARELISDALLLRRNAAIALVRIYVALAWPRAVFPAAPVLDGYRQLHGSAMLLGRLQNPAIPVRISVSL